MMRRMRFLVGYLVLCVLFPVPVVVIAEVTTVAPELRDLRKKYLGHGAKLMQPDLQRLIAEASEIETLVGKNGDLKIAIEVQKVRKSLAEAENNGWLIVDVPDLASKEAIENVPGVFSRWAVAGGVYVNRLKERMDKPRRIYLRETERLSGKFRLEKRLTDALAAEKENAAMTAYLKWIERVVELPADAELFNAHFYALIPRDRSWKQAKGYCEDLAGHLVVVTSKEENDFVSKIANGQSVWAGATDEIKEGRWIWVTGEAFEFQTWEPEDSQPDNRDGKQHFLRILTNTHWDDAENDHDKFACVCEWVIPTDPALVQQAKED